MLLLFGYREKSKNLYDKRMHLTNKQLWVGGFKKIVYMLFKVYFFYHESKQDKS